MRRAPLVLAALALLPGLAVAGSPDVARRGKRIYFEGQGRGPISVSLAGPRITAPGSAFPCASCHLPDGSGAAEAGIRAADITASTLTKEFSGIRPSGRAHPPYTDETLGRAVRAGIDPAGNVLHEAHPRYAMRAEDLDDLVTYLKVLGREPVPGVSEAEIRVGILRPDRGPLAASATAVTDLLRAYFEELNARGGLFRRALRLVPVPFDPTRGDSVAAVVKDLIDKDDVLCLLANLGVPPEDESLGLLSAAQVPVVAPVQSAARDGYGADRNTFHVYASVHDQARLMVDFLTRLSLRAPARPALLRATDRTGEAGAAGAREQAARHGLSVVAEVAFAVGRLSAADAVSRLRSAGADAVLFFGPGGDAMAFFDEADRERWRPSVLAPAPLVGASVLSLPADVARTVYLSSPLAGLDVSSRDAAAFLHLAARSGRPGEYSSFQLVAYAGAKLLEEGLRRSGRDVTRARLVRALGGLSSFSTGITPPLTYGANRRVGALGAQILAIDTDNKRLVVAAPWREPQ